MAHILDEPNVPALRVPEYMTREGAYQIVHLGAGFTEVFPGLEAAIFLPPDDEGKIIAHFRLTPKDGQEHDGHTSPSTAP